MKSLRIKAFAGIVAVCSIVTMSCATIGAEVIIRNSEGYDYAVNTEENRQKIDRPEWVSGNGFAKLKEENEKNGIYLFMGQSIPEWNSLIKEQKNYWTEGDAVNEALRKAMEETARFISTEIKFDYDERIKAAIQRGGTEQNGVTVAELKQYQDDEVSILEFQANSSSTFEGLNAMRKFTETLERTIIEQKTQRKITATRCWIVYSITQEEVSKARQRIEEARQKRLDDDMRRKSLENREAEKFVELSGQYDEIIVDLGDPDISVNQTLFGEKYNVLLFINASLRTLSTLETRNDDTGENYRYLRGKIAGDILTYNPNDRQRKLIQDLRSQLREKDARLDELRNRMGNSPSSQEYKLSTTIIVISYPQKPYETEVPAANIFAANDMVTNLDYISFTNANGINSTARAENGLYAPATLVTRNDAARYCNWLSQLYGLKPCYDESGGRIRAYNNKNNGYRLPEEHEIIAMLGSESNIINEAEFTEKGIWSSTGFSQEYAAYKLSGGTGSVANRLGKQSFANERSDAAIGFRVVRNAQ